MKEVDSGTHKGVPLDRGTWMETPELMNMDVTGKKGDYLLSSFAEVPTRGIYRRRVVGTRHATLQRPGKQAYGKICSISDRSVGSDGEETVVRWASLNPVKRLFHRRSMKKMR